jgi:hypothetical protein
MNWIVSQKELYALYFSVTEYFCSAKMYRSEKVYENALVHELSFNKEHLFFE